ncbi:hypothetical protein ACIBQ3_12775 [Streptomyces rubiginosohelvolus]|uniref:hypothetical protein n=1 Tax=Streptomyces rubiginosohelvolus TaxID=67362 RepID=UPI0037BBC26F
MARGKVAPDATWAVFAGVHAVRAVGPSGATRWEVRHGCLSGGCEEIHESYADRRHHQYPESGSVGFSADGRLVWAHVRGPLPRGGLSPDTADEWLVSDTTAAHGFVPVDYPSPVCCAPTALGGGFWSTLSPSRDVVHVWSPDGPES